MALAENPNLPPNEDDLDALAGFEPQRERISSEVGRVQIDHSLDSMEAGNRKPGILHHALVAVDAVGGLTDDQALPHQISNTRRLFNQFEDWHHSLNRERSRIAGWTAVSPVKSST